MSMKIPVFEEILLDEITIEKLRIIISDSRIGKGPCYLNLSTREKTEIDAIIGNLEQVLIENNLHPLFPYPFYIVSTIPLKTILPWVKSVKELPAHYSRKLKRPNNKELQLLNKLSLKVDKIKNLELYNIINDLKDSSIAQKKLYLETKELYFLEHLDAQLFLKTKK